MSGFDLRRFKPLQEENKRYREALEKIANRSELFYGCCEDAKQVVDIARQALDTTRGKKE